MQKLNKKIFTFLGAYKDIDVVMENSKELVKIEHTLRQIVNVKGD